MSGREELLESFRPGMQLTKRLLRNIYAWEMDYPGFAEQAIAALEGIGYSRAREHYQNWVNQYETAYEAENKEVAHWYRLECEREWEKRQKEGEEKRKREKMELLLKRKKLLLRKKLQILTGN